MDFLENVDSDKLAKTTIIVSSIIIIFLVIGLVRFNKVRQENNRKVQEETQRNLEEMQKEQEENNG